MKIRVLCVDDAKDITCSLDWCIRAERDMESAGCLYSANDLRAEVDRKRPDVILLDMHMPGKDPLEALRELTAAGGSGAAGSVRVIAYSGRDDQTAVDSAIEAGAWGYVSKDTEVPRLLEAIRAVARASVPFGTWR